MIATETKKLNNNPKCWGFFYRNDKPGGIGIYVPDYNLDYAQMYNKAMNYAFENLESKIVSFPPSKETYFECFEQLTLSSKLLNEYIQKKKLTRLDREGFFNALYRAFLSWLVLLKHGQVTPDEYNGFSFIYID